MEPPYSEAMYLGIRAAAVGGSNYASWVILPILHKGLINILTVSLKWDVWNLDASARLLDMSSYLLSLSAVF